LNANRLKYILSALVVALFAQLVAGASAPRGAVFGATADPALRAGRAADTALRPETMPQAAEPAAGERAARRRARTENRRRVVRDSTLRQERDSLFAVRVDSLVARRSDSLERAARRDTAKRPRAAAALLDAPITSRNTDSLVYDVRNKRIYIYNEGDVTYQKSNLKADYIRIDMDSKIVHAYGTVQARTWYEIRANRSLTGAEKSYTGREKHRFALTFGTKRVNFYGNSRIYGGDCDKIIEEFPLSVPGVFTLPVTLVRETYRQYEPIPVERSAEELQSEMEAELRGYLDSLVEDGSVMSASVRFSEKNGVLTATLSAECLEDIGRTVLMDAGEIEQIRMENAARRAAGEDQSND